VGLYLSVRCRGWLKAWLRSLSEQTLAQLVTSLSESPSVQHLGVNRTQIEMFNADPQTTLQIGRVLYPRFLLATRAGFQPSMAGIRPSRFSPPGFCAHQSISKRRRSSLAHDPGSLPVSFRRNRFGCQRTDYLEVRLILFPDSDTAYLSTPLTVPCN